MASGFSASLLSDSVPGSPEMSFSEAQEKGLSVRASLNPASYKIILLRAKIASPKGLLFRGHSLKSLRKQLFAHFTRSTLLTTLALQHPHSLFRRPATLFQSDSAFAVPTFANLLTSHLPINNHSHHVRRQKRSPPVSLHTHKQRPCHPSCLSSCRRQSAASSCEPHCGLRYQWPSSAAGHWKPLWQQCSGCRVCICSHLLVRWSESW